MNDIAQALDEIGDNGENATYQIALPPAAIAGVWHLLFNGQATTVIPRMATPVEVQDVLQLLPNVGAGNVQVIGVIGGPYQVEMAGSLGAMPLPMLLYPFTGDGSDLVGPDLEYPPAIAITQCAIGAAPQLADKAAALWMDLDSIGDLRLRFLRLKLSLIDILLGHNREQINRATDTNSEELSQKFDHLRALRVDTEREMNSLLRVAQAASLGAALAPQAGTIRKRTPNGLPYGALGSVLR